jgi:Ser/Thr protein kinase RdoA (MazF antagonist)
MNDAEIIAAEVLPEYDLAGALIRRIDKGLINRTFEIGKNGKKWILQKVNPIFSPEVHFDIEAVTSHIEHKGMLTPRLLKTRKGSLWTEDRNNGIWRMMTFIEGIFHDRAPDEGVCFEAGRIAGRFHETVSTLSYRFRHKRLNVHNTIRHFRHLKEVLETYKNHRLYKDAECLGRRILSEGSSLMLPENLPPRIVHGDLKLNNIVFSKNGRATALVDLDTFSEMNIPVELGDAWRSWCNPEGEDASECSFNIEYFKAALEGYGESGKRLLSQDEIAPLPYAAQVIALELASRFCSDALEECYFGWDSSRFPDAGSHNLVRAANQYSLARSITLEADRIKLLVFKILGKG